MTRSDALRADKHQTGSARPNIAFEVSLWFLSPPRDLLMTWQEFDGLLRIVL